MQQHPSHPLSLLIVTAEEDLRTFFAEMLSEEGYQVQVAASLAEALQRTNDQAFALVLADLFVGSSPHAFTDAHILRRRVHPTPMGLMMTLPLSLNAASQAGFAFVLSMPFELEDCLSQIAMALNHSLSLAQQAQAEIVERYFTAVLAEDWQGALALCTDDLAFYPPRLGMTRPARRLDGKTAALAYLQKAAQRAPLISIASLIIYPSPRGLVARWTGAWGLPDGSRLRRVSTTTFRFRGERISQVGLAAIPAWGVCPGPHKPACPSQRLADQNLYWRHLAEQGDVYPFWPGTGGVRRTSAPASGWRRTRAISPRGPSASQSAPRPPTPRSPAGSPPARAGQAARPAG